MSVERRPQSEDDAISRTDVSTRCTLCRNKPDSGGALGALLHARGFWPQLRFLERGLVCLGSTGFHNLSKNRRRRRRSWRQMF